MDRRPSDRILDEWDGAARTVRRPADAPRRRVVRGSVGIGSLVPLMAAALIIAVGIAWLGGRESRPSVGASESPPASQIAVAASATPEPSSPARSPSPTASAPVIVPTSTPEPSPTPAPCTMTAEITSWEGAAGSRIANLTATNAGDGPCAIPRVSHAQLIDGSARVLADSGTAPTGGALVLAPGESVHTMASVSNVCVDPVAPVTIRLNLGDGGTVRAKPPTPDDATVPPCNGPGQPSDMSIQGWAR